MPESWGNITDLSVLILSSSGLTSLPHSIAKWANIELLDVSSCASLTSLPVEINSLTSLRYFSSSNSPVRTAIALQNFPVIKNVYFRNSNVTGELALQGLPSSLEILDAGVNNLQSVVTATSMDGLSSLVALYIDGNVGITGVLPNLSGAVKLQTVWMSSCGFTGGIPSIWLSTFATTLKTLILSRNQLTGPDWQAVFADRADRARPQSQLALW